MSEILVLAEHHRGELRDVTFEMLALAHQLGGETPLPVAALLLGHGAADLCDKLRSWCDTLLLVEDPYLADFNPEFYLVALQKIIKNRRPLVTLLGHTAQGMDLSPALAARLSLPLVTDCLEAQLVDGTLQVQRQIYGGKINASLSVKPSPQYLITLRPGAFPADTVQDKDGLSEIIPAPVWEGLRGRRFLNYLDAQIEDLDIADAGILVSVGRGIGKRENISLVQDFADTIGATLSCSRPVADKGWLPKSRQVGTSGKTVRPKVYLALGISGAFQHQAGMKNSGTIIAVNKDPRAPIFSVAHYGIVGDLFQTLPVLMEKFVKK